jgi:hypothetical protein
MFGGEFKPPRINKLINNQGTKSILLRLNLEFLLQYSAKTSGFIKLAVICFLVNLILGSANYIDIIFFINKCYSENVYFVVYLDHEKKK